MVGVDTELSLVAAPPAATPRWRHGGRRPFLDWASVEPFVGHVPTVRLRVPLRKLAKLHPAQIADLVEAASHEEGEEIIERRRRGTASSKPTSSRSSTTEHQVEFLRERSDQEARRRARADGAR